MVQYTEVPVSEILPSEVLIRVRATILDYSDICAREDVPELGFIFPHISASDACGVVEAVRSEVKNVRVGDEGVVSISICCGHSTYCMEGAPLFCSDLRIRRFQTGPPDGGEAEYASRRERDR